VPTEKRILCHSPSDESFRQLRDALRRAAPRTNGARHEVLPDGEDVPIACDSMSLRWVSAPDTAALLYALEEQYVNLIVFDLRCADDACLGVQAAHAFHVLDVLDRTEDVEGRYAFHRIVVLMPRRSSPVIDEVILRFGAHGVGTVLREGDDPDRFAAELLGHAARLLRTRKTGRRALCASGGGITGLYFELGALKCLDDALGGGGLADFDMYFGISAGAVVTAPICIGYSVDEFMAAVANVPGGRVAPLDLRLFRLGHVDARTFGRRFRSAARTTAFGAWSALTGRHAPSKETLLFDYADLVAAPFKADGFEKMLRDVMEAPFGTNDFRALPKPLYVGATDQDARAHVLFGDEQHLDVPISQAVQASLSINPAFSATKIGDRWYEDGAVTRTSNFAEAIRRGATLVFVVDPFVPYVAREPGFASRRGMLYNVDQDVRTISYTRYETTRNWVLRRHPEVSSYTFVPANRLRRLMSINPMDHRPYMEIWRGAYLSTFNRLRAVHHRLAGDVAVHGFDLNLDRAAAVAERLEAVATPTFADFFPDGKIAIKRPQLVGQRRAERVERTAPVSLRRTVSASELTP
jgi:predicted acylesterase/phospholipase RssA